MFPPVPGHAHWGGHRETQVSYIDRRLQMTSNDMYKLTLKRKRLYSISNTLRTRPFNQSEVIFRKKTICLLLFFLILLMLSFLLFRNAVNVAVLLVYIRKNIQKATKKKHQQQQQQQQEQPMFA